MVDQNGILQLSGNIAPRFRYPGFQPFTQQQEHIFFGRDKDIDNLSRSVLQNPCTVIFGKSGIGKSSLINAGLLPKIAQQNKNGNNSYYPISTFRFGAYNGESKEGGQVIDKFNSALPDVQAADNFLPDLRAEIKKTFWYKLKLRQFSAYSSNKTETFILVFDQLEQLFTYPESQIKQFLFALSDLLSPNLPDAVEEAIDELKDANKYNFSSTVLDVLHTPIPIKILLSIRSDKLNLISRLGKAIPSLLRNVYELLPLTEGHARQVIVKPANDEHDFASPRFFYEEKLLNNIINFGRQPGDEATISQEESSIEPFNLQIICSHIEKRLKPGDKNKTVTLEEIGPLENVINEYITDKLRETFPDEQQQTEIISIICAEFIDEKNKVRKMVYSHDLGANEEQIEKLCETGLIRREVRGPNQTYFELSHDRLVEPILKAANNQHLHIKQQGDILCAQQKYDEAIETYSQYLNSIKGSSVSPIDVYLSRADTYSRLGKYAESNNDYLSILKIRPNDTGVLFKVAINFVALNNDDEAEKYIDKAVELNPSYAAETYNEIGVNYYNAKIYEQAKKYFEKAISRNAQFDLAYYNLGLIYNTQKEYQHARDFLSVAVKLNPQFEDAIYELGNSYYDELNYEKAQEYYQTTLSVDPSYYRAYYQLGLVESQKQHYEQAVTYFQQAISLNDKYEKAYQQRGILLTLLERYEEAIKDLEKMIELNPKSDQGYSTLGLIYVNSKDYDKAIKNLDTAISIQPTANSFYYLGLAKAGLNKTDEAIIYYQKTIEADNTYEPAFEQLFLSYLDLNKHEDLLQWYQKYPQRPHSGRTLGFVGQALYYLHEFEDARAFLKKAIELNPDNIDGYLFLAYLETDEEHPADAINYYKELIKIVPNYDIAYRNAGLLLEKSGQYQEAISFYESTIKIKPDSATGYNDLGNIYYAMEDFDLASKNYQKAIELDPTFFYTYYNLGLIASKKLDPDLAIAYYKKGMEIAPIYLAQNSSANDTVNTNRTFGDLLINIGSIYMFDKDEFEEAKKYFSKFLDLHPDNANGYYWMGLAEYHLHNLKEAQKNYEKAIELDPQFDEAYFEMGNIKLDEENYDDALGFFETVIKLNPKNSDAYINLGHCYFNLNPFKRVEAFSKKAIEIAPNHSNTYIAYNNLAEAQLKLEKYDEALASGLKAKELQPHSDLVNATLGEVYEKLNKMTEAVSSYKESLKANPNNDDAKKRLEALEKS